MGEAAATSTEIMVLGWSAALLLLHVFVQMLFYVADVGLAYAVSNRDGSRTPGPIASRLSRGIANYVETYGIFIALALTLALTGKTGGWGATGALVWFWARAAYAPVFAAGIPVLRTGLWTVSMFGLLMMLLQVLA